VGVLRVQCGRRDGRHRQCFGCVRSTPRREFLSAKPLLGAPPVPGKGIERNGAGRVGLNLTVFGLLIL